MPSLQGIAARAALLTLFALLAGAALLLAARRLAGALERPLDGAHLVVVAGVVALTAMTIRALGQAIDGREIEPGVRWGPTLLVAMIALALSLPGTTLGALVAFWAVLVAEELATTQFAMRVELKPRARPRTKAPDRESLAWAAQAVPASREAGGSGQVLLLQMTHLRDAEGRGTVQGTVRAEFLPEQRTAAIHLAFCPPLAETPQFEVEQVDGPEARVKVSQLLAYGARLEVRLAETPRAATSVQLEFAATGLISA